ncbi:unnamed protein product [Caenorhabditis sp. 36 PRJEB53466]|nr:unnamed protein product [Caenorhabditis sp. 36 PRJEB53466]
MHQEFPTTHSVKVIDFDKAVSEDEKKRLKNTEAARKCREKIKTRLNDLEETLNTTTAVNDAKNQHRIRFLSQIGEQMRMLDVLKKRNPALGPTIDLQVREIVDGYKHAVTVKRKAIAEHFSHISKPY